MHSRRSRRGHNCRRRIAGIGDESGFGDGPPIPYDDGKAWGVAGGQQLTADIAGRAGRRIVINPTGVTLGPSENRLHVRWSVDTPMRRRTLFAALYFSEGAPIGFLWWALPTQLRTAGVAVDEITALTAMLTLPWAFKFLWAPAVDALHNRGWSLRWMIVSAQLAMVLSLVPLFGLDLAAHLDWLRGLLCVHALAASTQDVAIDAWCIAMTPEEERGRINGWMQAGMLLGRSLLGGGALVLAGSIGDHGVLAMLFAAITSSLLLLCFVRPPLERTEATTGSANDGVWPGLARAVRSPVTWLGLAYVLIAGAAFEALGAIHGPMLIDLGWSRETVGWWLAIPVVGAMVFGSLSGGWLADRFGHIAVAGGALLAVGGLVGLTGLAILGVLPADGNWTLPALLAAEAIGVGVLTASTYALLMDACHPEIAATQFSTFMAAGNGCEIWAGWLVGRLASQHGYGPALLVLAGLSLFGLTALAMLQRSDTNSQS